MNRILCGLLALGVFAGAVGQGHADYAYTSIDFPGAQFTYAEGVNASGQVVGSYLGRDNTRHGFLFSGGTYTSFDPPGALLTDAYAINNSGQIVGRFQTSSTTFSGFMQNGGAYTTLRGRLESGWFASRASAKELVLVALLLIFQEMPCHAMDGADIDPGFAVARAMLIVLA